MKITSLAAIAILAAGFAASALAAGNSPSRSVYHPHAAQVQAVLGTDNPHPRRPDRRSRLRNEREPAVHRSRPRLPCGRRRVLLATGYSLRRLTRKPPTA